MDDVRYKCLLISDFNIMNFANLLKNDVQFPLMHTVVSPFSQVMPTLMEEDSEWWKSNPHVVIV